MRSVLITIFSVLLLDQFLKLWVKANYFLYDEIGELGFIKLQFIENPGMAFGMEFGGIWGKVALSSFRVIAVVAIWFVIRNLINNKAHKGLIFAAALVFAGAVGNILDSAFYGVIFDNGTVLDTASGEWVGYYDIAKMNFEGYTGFFQGCVVDMIHFEFFYPTWMPFDLAGKEVFPPVFNIADFSISTGVVMVIVFNKRFLGNGKGDFSIFKKQKNQEVVASESSDIIED